MSSRHLASAFIFAKFAGGQEGQIDIYPGQVQYYIQHALDMPDGRKTFHSLAHVRWYRPAPSSSRQYHYSFHGENSVDSGIELWFDDFYEISQDSLIPVHQIAGRFVPIKVTVGRTNYLAVVPINRRFHL